MPKMYYFSYKFSKIAKRWGLSVPSPLSVSAFDFDCFISFRLTDDKLGLVRNVWNYIKPNLLLYWSYYAEACNEFAGPISSHSANAIVIPA